MPGGSAKDRRKALREGDAVPAKKIAAKDTKEEEKIIPKTRRAVKLVWAIIGIGLTLLGAYLTIWPKLDASVSESLFPNNPFFARFEFKNASNFGMKNFHLQCGGLDLKPREASNAELAKLTDSLNLLIQHSTRADTPFLDAGSSVVFSCALGDASGGEEISQSLELNGRIFFIVRYRYLFWPKQIVRFVSFQAYVDSNHHTQWIKKTLSAEDLDSLEKIENEGDKNNPNAPYLR